MRPAPRRTRTTSTSSRKRTTSSSAPSTTTAAHSRARSTSRFRAPTSNLQADQADVEHGLYETAAGEATNPGAPGCNNGAPTCAGDPAATQSGYQFRYANGGTSGLPSAAYVGPLSNVLSNPA